VTLENDYAKSKLEAENILLEYSKNNEVNVYIYRLQNAFGKWCKPNYNSVIATWCNNIANNLDIEVNNKDSELNLIYIDDIVDSFIEKLNFNDEKRYFEIETVYTKTLGEIKDLLYSFKDSRKTLLVSEVGSGFERALYATYLSYLPIDGFSYELKGHKDERGTFYEMLKTQNSGQVSISTTAVGVARGGHYHHTKNEKFLVLKGKALIKLRSVLSKEIVEYKVSGEKMEVVEMIPGYTHNLKNIGDEELSVVLWANENYDKKNPDTYLSEV
ncbi:MAG: NAD-dependent epimerase/dehydratase family protein, partial [Sulfurimonas sp.]|nr:NAD-dependent epimerase/dehydratase family protein [Sulfurimonas sp.]